MQQSGETAAMQRRERSRREMRESILGAARDMVARQGFASLSMRAIAREIGYSPAALYEYFPSRDALSQALYFEGVNGLGGRIRATIESLGPDTSASQVALALGRGYREYALENRELYLLVFTTPNDGTVPGTETDPEASGGFELLVETLQQGMQRGEMRESDPHIAALALWSVVHGFILLEMMGYLGDGSREESDQAYDALLQHVSAWSRSPAS